MTRRKILIVEDDLGLQRTLRKVLGQDFDVEAAHTCIEAKQSIKRQEPHLILLDVVLPDGNGLDLLAWLVKREPTTSAVVITGQGEKTTALEATRLGAINYLTKPVDREILFIIIENAIKTRMLKKEVIQLRDQVGRQFEVSQIVGQSDAARKFRHAILAAREKEYVMVVGENGNDHEWVARAIHRHTSPYLTNFVTVNCAKEAHLLLDETSTIRRTLFDTGTTTTLYLHLVGVLGRKQQEAILALIQEGCKCVRVIASTQEQLNEPQFSSELYNALGQSEVLIPSLRHRAEDIHLLAHHFLHKHRAIVAPQCQAFSQEAIEKLQGYLWPGNMQQFESVLVRIMTNSPNQMVTKAEVERCLLQVRMGEKDSGRSTMIQALLADPDNEILKVMNQNDWFMKRAAKALGIHRNTLRRKLERMGITHEVLIEHRQRLRNNSP